jgi:hypothetical protein
LSAAAKVAGVTGRTVAPAGTEGMGLVRTLVVRTSQPPSGSESESSISYSVSGSTSKIEPE